DQYARIEDARRVERALCGAQRGGERFGTLAVVPGAVRAPDGVVVGAGAARREDCLRGCRLELRPLRELASAASRSQEGEVRRGPVRVDVSEAAGEDSGPTDAPQGIGHRGRDTGVQRLEPLPGAGGFEGVGDDA